MCWQIENYSTGLIRMKEWRWKQMPQSLPGKLVDYRGLKSKKITRSYSLYTLNRRDRMRFPVFL